MSKVDQRGFALILPILAIVVLLVVGGGIVAVNRSNTQEDMAAVQEPAGISEQDSIALQELEDLAEDPGRVLVEDPGIDLQEPVTTENIPPAPSPETPVPQPAPQQPVAPSTPEPEPEPEPEPAAPTTTYSDGIYSTVGTYVSPGGVDDVSVQVTLADDQITALSFTGGASNPTSQNFIASFDSLIEAESLGKSLDEADVERLGGASLTSDAFNILLDNVRSQAQI